MELPKKDERPAKAVRKDMPSQSGDPRRVVLVRVSIDVLADLLLLPKEDFKSTAAYIDPRTNDLLIRLESDLFPEVVSGAQLVEAKIAFGAEYDEKGHVQHVAATMITVGNKEIPL